MSIQASPIIEADLHSFVDGELFHDRMRAIAAYLVEHPVEAARVQIWRQQNNALIASFGNVAHEPLPVSLSLNVSAASRYHAAPVNPARAIPTLALVTSPAPAVANLPGVSSPVTGFLFGLSAAFAIGAAGLLAVEKWHPQLLVQTESSDSLARLATRAAEAHRTFSSLPSKGTELSSQEASAMLVWLSQRTGLVLHVPNFTGEGFRLVGVQVLPDAGSPLGLLTFQDIHGDRASLLLAAPGPTPKAVILVTRDADLTLVTTSARHSLMTLVFSTRPELLQRLLPALEQASVSSN